MGKRTVSAAAHGVLSASMIIALAACGGDGGTGDASRRSGGGPGTDGGAALLSADPIDQINNILAKAANLIPGEPYEVRFQVRLVPPDTLAVDYEQHRAGEPWETNATAVAAVGSFIAEITRGRFVNLTCETSICFEHRAPLVGLDLARLPAGEGRERFLEILRGLSTGTTDVAAEGGEDEINRLLRASAISYSETVSSWYQVSFYGDWMRVVTWQYTEGFTEHTLPGWKAVHLPTLGPVGAADPIPCREPWCVLAVGETPLRFVPPTTEDAERLAALINGLGEGGG